MQIDDLDLIDQKLKSIENENNILNRFLPESIAGREKLSRKELQLFASSLSSMLEGGISLLRGLQIITKQMSGRKHVLVIVKRVENAVRQGKSLSDAFREQPSVFPVFFIEMTAAGEMSGTLSIVLNQVAGYLEKEEERGRKIREALAYPLFVLFLGVITFFVLLKFVIPKIATVYDDFDGTLPLLTRLTLTASEWAVPAVFGGLLLSVPVIYWLRKNRSLAASWAMKLPLIGEILKQHLLSFFSSLLALELRSGITILTALESVQKTLSWGFFQRDIEALRTHLCQGEDLSDGLTAIDWVDDNAAVLIQAGQESGRLPESLEQVSRESVAAFESKVHFALKLFEPILILTVGVFVGFIVISAVLPILEINTLVR